MRVNVVTEATWNKNARLIEMYTPQNEWMNEWINEWKNEWKNECMNEWIDELNE